MVDLRDCIHYLPSQENIGCCTASATLLAIEMLCKVHNNPVLFSRLFTYYLTRKRQDRVGQHGAELLSTLETLTEHGACPNGLWPFMWNKVNTEPGNTARNEASMHRLESYSRVRIEEINGYLDNGIPVIIGMWTGRKFWKLRGDLSLQDYTPVNNTDNRVSKGHAMTIVGYDNDLAGGTWIVANSLGPKWGHRGYGAIPFSCGNDIGESYVIRSFAGMEF